MTRSERAAAVLLAAVVAVALWWLVAPAGGAPADGKRAVELGPQLVRLSAAVDATVAWDDPPPGLGDQALLELATRHDPSLRAPFAGHFVRVRRGARSAVLLVCDREGAALLEDAGCTAALDLHRWRDAPGPCAFTLDPVEACPGR